MLFGRKRPFDRSSSLEAAGRARAQGKPRKAIAEYRKILEHSPGDAFAHQKLAPLLVDAGDIASALESFSLAARAQVQQGFDDRAIGIYMQALSMLPKQLGFWEAVADLQVKRGRRADAVHSLLEGRQRFRGRREIPGAVSCLEKLLSIEPYQLEATLDLARLYRRVGRAPEGVALLGELERRVPAVQLQRVRGAQFRAAPGARTLWRWLFPRALPPPTAPGGP